MRDEDWDVNAPTNQDDMECCHIRSTVASHYNEDGTCRCDPEDPTIWKGERKGTRVDGVEARHTEPCLLAGRPIVPGDGAGGSACGCAVVAMVGCPTKGCGAALDVDLAITVRRQGGEWKVSHADLDGAQVVCTEDSGHAFDLTDEQTSELVEDAERALFAASGPEDL